VRERRPRGSARGAPSNGRPYRDHLRQNVLFTGDQLLVKRIARVPTKSGVVVHSDNPAYPSWEPKERSDVDIVGRVLWFGRRVG
jgi:hypothetical protein